jgi:LacI family transcriptional regulator
VKPIDKDFTIEDAVSSGELCTPGLTNYVMPAVHRIRKVALLVEWSRNFGRGVLRGIGQYVQTHGRWKVYQTERRLSDAAPPWLKTWQGDGVIARIENRRLAAQLKQLGIPVVDLFEHEQAGEHPALGGEKTADR